MIKISKASIITLITLLFGLFLCCFIIAFFVSEKDIQRWMLFGTFFFGFGSIVVSISALVISIRSYINTENEKRKIVKQAANNFLIENNDEIDYIPLCLIANIYDRHRKYKRKIYSSFNKLGSDVQIEVLKQLNYDFIKTNNRNWLRDSVNRIKEFVQNYDFGDCFILDYFEKSFNYSEKAYGINDADISIISSRYLGMQSLRFENGECYDNGITFRHYCELYLSAKIQNDLMLKLVPKPLDELNKNAHLKEADENSVCFWSIYVMDVFSDLIKQNPKNKIIGDVFPKVHAKIINYEDRLLYSLIGLFNLNQYKEDNK